MVLASNKLILKGKSFFVGFYIHPLTIPQTKTNIFNKGFKLNRVPEVFLSRKENSLKPVLCIKWNSTYSYATQLNTHSMQCLGDENGVCNSFKDVTVSVVLKREHCGIHWLWHFLFYAPYANISVVLHIFMLLPVGNFTDAFKIE